MLPFGGLRRAFANKAFGSRSNPTPPPPRITSLFSPSQLGLHANPSCGAKFERLLFVRFFRVVILAPVKPPVGPRSKFPITPESAVIGENHSHRRPILSV